jgi:hypothetical protein
LFSALVQAVRPLLYLLVPTGSPEGFPKHVFAMLWTPLLTLILPNPNPLSFLISVLDFKTCQSMPDASRSASMSFVTVELPLPVSMIGIVSSLIA